MGAALSWATATGATGNTWPVAVEEDAPDVSLSVLRLKLVLDGVSDVTLSTFISSDGMAVSETRLSGVSIIDPISSNAKLSSSDDVVAARAGDTVLVPLSDYGISLAQGCYVQTGWVSVLWDGVPFETTFNRYFMVEKNGLRFVSGTEYSNCMDQYLVTATPLGPTRQASIRQGDPTEMKAILAAKEVPSAAMAAPVPPKGGLR
jgi:hypothetical protein